MSPLSTFAILLLDRATIDLSLRPIIFFLTCWLILVLESAFLR